MPATFRILVLTMTLLPLCTWAADIYVRAGRLVDVVDGNVERDQVIVVREDRIAEVGSARGIAIPADAEVIDLSGFTVLPGLIDMHVHLVGDAEAQGYENLAASLPRNTLYGAVNARKTLDAGFTTVRNVGAGGFADVGRRQYTVRFLGQFDPSELNELIVGWSGDRPIYLNEVADVESWARDDVGDGVILRLIGLNFASGSARLTEAHDAILATVREALTEFPEANLVIEGHTDSFGSDASNQELSQARADAVLQYLLANSPLSPADVRALGYGESRPVANNETPEGRRRNRRIDIVIYPKW